MRFFLTDKCAMNGKGTEQTDLTSPKPKQTKKKKENAVLISVRARYIL